MFSISRFVYVLSLAVTLFAADPAQASLAGSDLQLSAGGVLTIGDTEDLPNIDGGLRVTYLVGNPGRVLTTGPGLDLPAFNLGSPLTYPVPEGTDGAFHPQENQLLSSDDWVFDFTSLYVPAGVSVDFARNGYRGPIYLLATEDVIIEGMLRDLNGTLAIVSRNVELRVGGSIQAMAISLIADESVILTGSVLPPAPVPLPGAFWLLGTGLGTLVFKRQGRRICRLRDF